MLAHYHFNVRFRQHWGRSTGSRSVPFPVIGSSLTVVGMKSLAVPILAAVMATACVTNSPVGAEGRTLPYGCNDLVLVGRIIENEAYEPVEDEDVLIGHGWISARIKVKKVLKGTNIPGVLPVRYFAHVHMREDRDFMFVIRDAEKGYEIETGQLMSVHPRLAARCD